VSTHDGDTPQEKIAKIISKAAPAAKTPRKPPAKQPLTPKPGVIYVAGNGNVVAGGNVTNHVHHHAPAPRPKVVVKTGDGTINAQQKAELLRLKNEWMAAHNAVKLKPLSHAAAFARLSATMKVNGYAELKPEQFEAAKAWLMRQTAMVRAMPSAPRKQGERWRLARYRAIKARCRNQLGDDGAYKPYIKANFKAESLTELGDAELERTYRYVMGKKA
jgi:hypothetical protein